MNDIPSCKTCGAPLYFDRYVKYGYVMRCENPECKKYKPEESADV